MTMEHGPFEDVPIENGICQLAMLVYCWVILIGSRAPGFPKHVSPHPGGWGGV